MSDLQGVKARDRMETEDAIAEMGVRCVVIVVVKE
jgi:hypothetical protein